MRKKYAVILGLIFVGFLVWIGFGSRKADSSTVRIGSVLVLSGNYKSMGEQLRDGQLLAIEELNAQPGRKKRLELTVYDSQGEKSVALEKVKALHRDSVSYVAEIFGSTEALHCLPFIREQKMLLLSGVDTGASLSSAGGGHFFRTIPSDALACRFIAQKAKEMGHRRAAIIYVNDVWGSGLRDAMTREVRQNGGEVVATIETVKNQDVFQPVVARLKTAAPDITFLFLYARDAAICIKEASRQGVRTTFVGTDNFTGSELPEVAGPDIEGVMYAVPSPPLPTSSAATLRTLYQKKFGAGKEPSLFTIQGYDAIHVLAKAIDATDSVDASIRFLERLKYQGAGGPISFNADHELAETSYTLQVFRYTQGGAKVEPLEEVAR